MRFLFATRDNGGFNVSHPVASALKAKGHDVKIAAEGLSAARWKTAGWELSFEGTVNHEVEPFDFDAERLLKDLQPNVVITTSGGPMNLENACALMANQMRIPLVWIEDMWGVSARLTAVPQMVFTLDEVGIEMLKRRAPLAQAQMYACGHPGLNALQIPPELEADIAAMRERHGRVIVFSGEGDGTVDLLHVMLSSLVDTEQRFVIIPRFHPTMMKNRLHQITWTHALEMFEWIRPGSVVWRNDVKSADALAALADVTVSGVSTLLLHAAKHGRMAVSIDTPWTRELLLTQSKVSWDHFPGIDAGIALHLTEPVDDLLAEIDAQADRIREAQRRYFAAPVMTPEDIAERILGMTKS